jgi:hypothetical protein
MDRLKYWIIPKKKKVKSHDGKSRNPSISSLMGVAYTAVTHMSAEHLSLFLLYV